MINTPTTEVAPELLIDHALAQVEADPRIQRALADLEEIVLIHYPKATFKVTRWTDPAGIYLEVSVNIDDTGELFDVVKERLLEIQIEERLPVHVILA